MCLFIAIDIPNEVKEKIRTSFLYPKDTLEFARFTEPQNLHVTLVFLGETSESLLESVKSAVEKTAKANTARQLMIAGLAIGPDENLARMIWLKLDNESQKYLNTIAAQLKNGLRSSRIGFNGDYRTFDDNNGHITLARFSQRWQNDFQSKNDKFRREQIAKIKETFPDSFGVSFDATGIKLFLSLEENGDRIYKPLFESEFKK